MTEPLQKKYSEQVVPALVKSLGLNNAMRAPKIVKIVVNVGVGKFKDDKKKIETVAQDLAKITGQAPVLTKSRKSIAGFKVREQQVVGAAVTLRGNRMWSFLDKLINITLPRVRDFRGVPQEGFDGRGSYHLGLREQLVFPEISADSLENAFGLQVSVVTNAGSDAPARELLTALGFPFAKK